MTRRSLVFRSLIYFRGTNLAVMAGVAIATAVLTGALMVGDSVRGSLAQLTESRLGSVDHVLAAAGFFREDLARRVAAQAEFASRFSGAGVGISARGGLRAEGGRATTAGVDILAAPWAPVRPGECILNHTLAEAADIRAPGAAVLLTMAGTEQVPLEATLARRDRASIIRNVRASVAQITGTTGPLALFSLSGGQRPPRNAWVNAADLQQALEQEGRANLLFVTAKSGHGSQEDAARLDRLLRLAADLDDYGLSVQGNPASSQAALISRVTFLPQPVEQAAQRAAERMQLRPNRILAHLVNTAQVVGEGGRKIHYAAAAGVDDANGPLGASEVAVNQWTARQLGAKVGDRLRLSYYIRRFDGELVETTAEMQFTIARILPMEGIGADNTLTPRYAGLTDADSVADWNPPVGLRIDKSLVTREDEAYWARYRAAPKILLNIQTAQRLWGGNFGRLTSIRVPAERADEFAAHLLANLDPAAMGMQFVPIKSQQLAAATGGTDFAGLFVGFSFFLIVSAALLTAVLLGLGIEQRARQTGLLAAVGFDGRTLRRMALTEGMTLAVIGGVAGVAGGVAYTWLMIVGLRTWWFDAIGTTSLSLQVRPGTLGIGFGAGLLVAAVVIWLTARRVGRIQPAALLAGGATAASALPVRGGGRSVLAALLLSAAATLLVCGATKILSREVAFLGGAGALLASWLLTLSRWLATVRRTAGGLAGAAPAVRLGLRNARRHPGRSTSTVALISLASFLLVTVASMRQGPPPNPADRTSPTGGYRLIVRTDIPLGADPSTRAGRQVLGMRDLDSPLWSNAAFYPVRAWAGQDISCLNITRPTVPTILAVSAKMRERGGFSLPAGQWALLDEPAGDDVPVIADDETARYILKLPVGGTLPITDQRGQRRNLRLAATLPGSIFQGELLMGEANFARLFPGISGFSMLLVDAPAQRIDGLRRLLAEELDEYAAVVERTEDRLMAYRQVANTYLSTFQALGGLGMALGTAGLGALLLRNLFERRGEMALLEALGFARRQRVAIVLAENALLLTGGIALGAACALLAVLPAVASGSRSVNWVSLALTLAAVAAFGLLAVAAAMRLGLRWITPADLRAE